MLHWASSMFQATSWVLPQRAVSSLVEKVFQLDAIHLWSFCSYCSKHIDGPLERFACVHFRRAVNFLRHVRVLPAEPFSGRAHSKAPKAPT